MSNALSLLNESNAITISIPFNLHVSAAWAEKKNDPNPQPFALTDAGKERILPPETTLCFPHNPHKTLSPSADYQRPLLQQKIDLSKRNNTVKS